MNIKKNKIISKHLFDNKKKFGETKLGLASSYVWQNDPRRLFISLSRYKFVSKMLEGKKNVLEIGGDSFRNRLVKQVVDNLTVIHPEKEIINTVTIFSESKIIANIFLVDKNLDYYQLK